MATGAVVVVWQLYLQLSVPITTEVVSSNPAHGEVCSIQNYVSLSVTCNMSMVFSTSKTDRHDITEILLKMALNTTTITHNLSKWKWTGPYSFSFAWVFRIHIQTWLHLRTSSFWVSMTRDLESCPLPKRDIHVPMSDNTKLSELFQLVIFCNYWVYRIHIQILYNWDDCNSISTKHWILAC